MSRASRKERSCERTCVDANQRAAIQHQAKKRRFTSVSIAMGRTVRKGMAFTRHFSPRTSSKKACFGATSPSAKEVATLEPYTEMISGTARPKESVTHRLQDRKADGTRLHILLTLMLMTPNDEVEKAIEHALVHVIFGTVLGAILVKDHDIVPLLSVFHWLHKLHLLHQKRAIQPLVTNISEAVDGDL